jgi:glycosyltransferase involved in cell wall biosynthesis
MNILLVNYGLGIGGQEAHVLHLGNYLAARGHRVLVWTKGGAYEEELRGCVHRKVPFDQLAPWPRRRMLSPAYRRGLRRFARDVRETLAREQIHLVHCHGVTETHLMRAALGRRPVPLLYSSHGWFEHQWDWHMRYLGRCDFYIGVSEFTCEKFRHYGVPAERIAQIPYGIPYRVPPDAEQVRALRAQLLGPHEGGCIVLTVARLHRQKGHDVLLRAMPLVLARHPRTVFVFVGEGPERGALKQLAAENGLSSSVRFVGGRRDVTPYLHAADIFCLPSRFEALPLVIPEAFRAGLPVVVTRVAGCPEIVEHGRTGQLATPESPDSLAESLLALLYDPTLRQRMAGEALQAGSGERFDPDCVHGRIETLYEQLVNRPPVRQRFTPFESLLSALMR